MRLRDIDSSSSRRVIAVCVHLFHYYNEFSCSGLNALPIRRA